MPISRSDFTLPRWARTALGVDATTNVTEPPSQKKDTGYVPGVDSLNASWTNFWRREVGKSIEYLLRIFEGDIVDNQLVRKVVQGGGFDITRTGSYEITIAAGAAYLNGQYFDVPQTVITYGEYGGSVSALHRIYYVQLVGGVPTISEALGTVNDTDPTFSSLGVAICRVRQSPGPSGANAPIDDLRVAGVVSAGELTVDQDVNLSALSGTTHYRVEIDETSLRLGVDPGNNLTGLITITDTGSVDVGGEISVQSSLNRIQIEPRNLQYKTARTTIQFIAPSQWTGSQKSGGAVPTYDAAAGRWVVVTGAEIAASFQQPIGYSISRVRVYVDPNTGSTATLALVQHTPGSFSPPTVVASTTSTGTGNQTLTLLLNPLPAVAVDTFFEILITNTGGSLGVLHGTVETTVTINPFGVNPS